MLFITKVCLSLDRNRVRYAIVGGYAVALHGAVRGTMDVDIVINWDLRSLRGAERALGELGLISRLPVAADDIFQFRDEYIKNRNLIAWNFYHPEDASQQVDIIITFDLKGKGRQTLETLDGPIRVLNKQDLIEMKQKSGRPQDLEDVKALEKLE
jgi:hypothetical protein